MIMMICYLYVGHHRDIHKFLCIISLHKRTCTCLALQVLNYKPTK